MLVLKNLRNLQTVYTIHQCEVEYQLRRALHIVFHLKYCSTKRSIRKNIKEFQYVKQERFSGNVLA